jgi:hypothetical protein
MAALRGTRNTSLQCLSELEIAPPAQVLADGRGVRGQGPEMKKPPTLVVSGASLLGPWQ